MVRHGDSTSTETREFNRTKLNGETETSVVLRRNSRDKQTGYISELSPAEPSQDRIRDLPPLCQTLHGG